MTIKRQEKISFYTHLFGALASLAGLVLLLIMARNSPSYIFVAFIYGLSVIFLFLASSLYHALKKKEHEISLWRKLDHFAIFVMIAGSYTPFCYIFLDGKTRWIIIGVQWGLVFIGLFIKLFFINAPRVVNTLVYVMMGWCVIFVIKKIYIALPADVFLFVFAGGIAYSIGAAMYGFKKPDPVPGFFGFHELFHLFILLGGFLQYVGVYLSFKG